MEDPALEAYRLRLSGLSNAEIVQRKLGFRTNVEVSKAIHSMLDRDARQMASSERETALQMELDRLDLLLTAYWELATGGSVADAKLVLDIIRTRIHLQQLDVPDARSIGQTVLVVRGDSEADYVSSLGGQISENES